MKEEFRRNESGPDSISGRIVQLNFDPEKSGSGFLFKEQNQVGNIKYLNLLNFHQFEIVICCAFLFNFILVLFCSSSLNIIMSFKMEFLLKVNVNYVSMLEI